MRQFLSAAITTARVALFRVISGVMEDSSDEENNILKCMGFSNQVIEQIKKKTRLKNIFSTLSSCSSSSCYKKVSPHMQKSVRNKEVRDNHVSVLKDSSAIEPQKDLTSPKSFIDIADNLVMMDMTNTMINNESDEHSLSILLDLGEEDFVHESQITSLALEPSLYTSENLEIDSQAQPTNLKISPQPACTDLPNLVDTQVELQSQLSSLDVRPEATILDRPEIESQPPPEIASQPPMNLEVTDLPSYTYLFHQPQQNFVNTQVQLHSQITSMAVQPLPQQSFLDQPEIEPQLKLADVAVSSQPTTDLVIQPQNSMSDVQLMTDLSGLLEASTSEPRCGRKRDIERVKRMKGESFLGFRKQNDKWIQDIERMKREIGPRCSSDACLKGGLTCRDISEEDRKNIFDCFWTEMDWDSKKVFIKSMVDVIPPKRRQKGNSSTNSRKDTTKKYHLKVKGQRVRVCRIFFLNSLGIKEWTVRYWLNPNANKGCDVLPASATSASKLTATSNDTSVPPPKRRCGNTSKHHTVIDFIELMPKVPSHYCRKSSSKLYLEPIVHSVNHLYQLYKEYYEERNQNTEIVSKRTFDRVFDKMNIGIFQPKKDVCDTCSKFKVGNLTKEAYDKHIKEKEMARELKTKDKQKAIKGECYVFTVDLQSVKLAPYLRTSSMYYKTKLCVYNYTVYNLADNRARCYWFTEVDTDLTASTFASCLVDILSEYIQNKPLPIIVYSDGCTYQNRNAIIANALLDLSIKTNVVIEQKYLIKGHTQMECDSVHSCIERKLKNREVYLPSQYAQIASEARYNPFPYEQKQVFYDFFKDYKQNMRYSSIKPSRTAVVTDIKCLKYEDGKIMVKITHDDNVPYEELAIRPRVIPTNYTYPNLHRQQLPIKKTKFQHIQELKQFIPRDCHAYYDNLPHKDK